MRHEVPEKERCGRHKNLSSNFRTVYHFLSTFLESMSASVTLITTKGSAQETMPAVRPSTLCNLIFYFAEAQDGTSLDRKWRSADSLLSVPATP